MKDWKKILLAVGALGLFLFATGCDKKLNDHVKADQAKNDKSGAADE